MKSLADSNYYLSHKESLLHNYDAEVKRWQAVMAPRYGADLTRAVLQESRVKYAALIAYIPSIGDDDPDLTNSLINSVQCLSLFRTMQTFGHSAAETGQVLYDAILALRQEPLESIVNPLTPAQLEERRRQRAALTQQRRYPEGYVKTYVPGDGETFDYGYDFTECAAHKFYHAHGGAEFLPHYCRLDFAWSEVLGLGLTRTQCLSTGDALCNHRFRLARKE
jgi:hypothetical protein